MSRPAATSLVTAYNYGRFIGAALESVLAQTVPASDHEVIVVDNGSTDDTRARVAAFGDRVRYHYQENFQGQAGTLNAGIALARGEVVSFLDADDLWAPDKVERVLERFGREPDLGAVQHGCRYIDATGTDLGVETLPRAGRVTLEDLLTGPVWGSHMSSMSLRRDILARIGPVPPDFAYTLPDAYLLQHGLFFAPAGNIRLALTLYRRHGRSWSDRWGEAKGNPQDLAVGHRAQRRFDSHLKRRLRAQGLVLRWPPEALAERKRERCERLALLSAYAGRRARALRLLGALVRGRRGAAEALFKAAALTLAAAAPGLYSRLYLLYRRRPAAALLLGRLEQADPFAGGTAGR